MKEITIKKCSKGKVTNYHYLDEDKNILDLDKLERKKVTTESFYYKVENLNFMKKEKAIEYWEHLTNIRKGLQYTEPKENIIDFFLLYQENGWQVDCPEECFWTYINKNKNTLKEYLEKRYPLIKKREFPEMKEIGWHYVSFIDWDDGDYDNYGESWNLMILSPKEISDKVQNIRKNIPGNNKKGICGGKWGEE